MDRHWLLKFGAGARHRVTRRAFSSGFLSALICGALKADAVKPFALDVRTVRLSPGVPTPFSFVHFSDTHLTETTATELAAAGAEGRALHERRAKVLYRNARAFAAVLTRIRETGSFAVNTGDLLDYVSDGGLSAAAAQRGLDILTTPGNHETMALDPARKLKEKAMYAALGTRIEESFGCRLPVEARTVKGVRFVAFDNAGVSRYRMAEALEALKREFAAGLPTVLCCHFPLYSPEILARERKGNKTKPARAWMMIGEEVEGVAPRPEEKAIVDFLKAQKNLKAVLAGHLHGFWQGTFNGVVPMIVAPANYDGRALEINLA